VNVALSVSYGRFFENTHSARGIIAINTNISALLSPICTVDAPANDRCAADSNSSALEEEEEKKPKKNFN
jgi:hypothetical protein